MALPQYIQSLIDSGEATIGVSNIDKEGSFIGHPFKIERRGVASTKQEATALGKPVFVDQKGNRVTVKTEPLAGTDGLSVVLKGKNIDTWGKANLARNSSNQLRRENARFVEPINMDEMEDVAAKKYGYISQALRDDTHHITGINSGARWKKTIPERRHRIFEKVLNSLGLYTGDHPRNQSAIPGERSIGRANLHQSVIHTAEDPRSVNALLTHFKLPNATHPKIDLVGPYSEKLPYTSQKEAAAVAGLAIERLGVQLAMLGSKGKGSQQTIQRSIDLIRNQLRNTEADIGPIGERPNNSNARDLIEMLDRAAKRR